MSSSKTTPSPLSPTPYQLLTLNRRLTIVLLEDVSYFDVARQALQSEIVTSMGRKPNQRRVGVMVLPKDSNYPLKENQLLELARWRIVVSTSELDDLKAGAQKAAEAIMEQYKIAAGKDLK